jgi:hypothetical protein
MPVNECVAFYDAGEDVTCHVEAAVTGKKLVKISDPIQAGSAGLSSTTTGGNPVVSPCGAGEQPFGVAAYDAAIGAKVPVIRGKKVLPLVSGAAITAGARVMSDSTGRVVTYVGTVDVAASGNAETLTVGAAAVPVGVILNSPGAADALAIVAIDI